MKICIYNLGCKVNQYENDCLVKQLSEENEVTTDLEVADYYIVNTCAVTNEGEKKSRQIISKINKLNNQAPIIVCGCASQKDALQFSGKKNVSFVLGTMGKMNIPNLIGKNGTDVKGLTKEYEEGLSLSLRTRSYLKIQDGCNNYCSYCLIPYVRGFSRSRELPCIINEAKMLSEFSKEIVLVGINLSDYKIEKRLALIDVVESLKDISARVRLGSLEVNIITEENLKRLQEVKNFCPHFHLSLQSGSNSVLKKMNRHYNREEYIEKCKLIYKYFPKASITTDIIVGFPTEKEKDFQDTLDLVKEVGFYSVHYFAYSSRSGTIASKFSLINGEIIKQRENQLKQVAKETQEKFLREHMEETLDMLVENREDENWVGYSANYIKCYCSTPLEHNKIYSVKPLQIYKDGYIVEKIK